MSAVLYVVNGALPLLTFFFALSSIGEEGCAHEEKSRFWFCEIR